MSKVLSTPRPLEVLLKVSYAIPVPDGVITSEHMNQEDGMTVDMKHYCFAGKETHKLLVEKGIITGKDASIPETKTWDWIKYMFDVFLNTRSLSSEIQDEARRLASCWYYIATQIQFISEDDDDDDDDNDEEEENVNLFDLIANAVINDEQSENEDEMMEGDEDSESDESYSEEDITTNPMTTTTTITNCSTTESNNPTTATTTTTNSFSTESNNPTTATTTTTNSFSTESNNPTTATINKVPSTTIVELTNNAPIAATNKVPKDTPKSEFSPEQIKNAIITTIDNLKAYLPSPSTDMIWFKRILKIMVPALIDTSWFPFGVPPIKPLIECLKSDDKYVREYASSILLVFKNQQEGQQQ
eukprot:TRINITY_DN1861_c0_g1_i1.p1 TRINITY_DN1861_c0_g1~~TRINITY_DN1861_c0_g1_i1.p1  ORF type:complete len:398 (+),score=81.94 TRINITY_DN1861_c0_g1_i1:118-1194(+)